MILQKSNLHEQCIVNGIVNGMLAKIYIYGITKAGQNGNDVNIGSMFWRERVQMNSIAIYC